MTIQGTLGQQILLNQTVTLSGSDIFENDINQQVVIFWNITGPVTGTSPTIQFTIQELDPSDVVTPIGQTLISPVITNPGTGQIDLAAATSSFILISWTVGGITPSFGGTNLAIISRQIGSILTSNQGIPNTLANAWTTEITDGYNGPVTVKAPSTAATAVDSALVVAISPNNPLTTNFTKATITTTSSVAASTSNVVLLASNSIRLGTTIFNDSNALLYLKLSAGASVTDFTIKMFPSSYYEVPYGYDGQIDGIWAIAFGSVSGFARISELT